MKCIYQISCVDPEVEEIYIGSTEDFKDRVRTHKTRYNLGYKFKVYNFIREHGGLSNWDIHPIEIIDFPISTDELKQYEQAYLDKYKPQLNSRRAHRTKEQKKELEKKYNKEWIKNNKEKVIERDKQYYQKNKEKYQKWRNARTNCPHCNKEMNKSSILQHIKSIHPTI